MRKEWTDNHLSATPLTSPKKSPSRKPSPSPQCSSPGLVRCLWERCVWISMALRWCHRVCTPPPPCQSSHKVEPNQAPQTSSSPVLRWRLGGNIMWKKRFYVSYDMYVYLCIFVCMYIFTYDVYIYIFIIHICWYDIYVCILYIHILYDHYHYMWWLKLKVCLQHRFPSREKFGHSTHLQILSNIWICIVSSHTSNAGIRGRKFFICKDALTSGRLLRNVLEIFQLRKWRNNLTRWIDPLLVQEIFTLFHHEFVSSSVAFGASSSHGELGRFTADFFLELRCPTIQRQFHQPGKLTKTWPPSNNSFKQKDTCCRCSLLYAKKSPCAKENFIRGI